MAKYYESNFSKRDNINPEASKYPKEAKAEAGLLHFVIASISLMIYWKISQRILWQVSTKSIWKPDLHLQNSYEVSISTFNGEFSPDEMGKISEILAKSREIEINEQTF